MEFSTSFLGWHGKIADDFTYESLHNLINSFVCYFKNNSTLGQKLIIGYDSRPFAKDFAEFTSCIMAENGIRVFLCNRPTPSSVCVANSLHKKSMGVLIITGDELNSRYLGLRAYDKDGYLIDSNILKNYVLEKTKKSNLNSIQTWKKKGIIESFDPMICYETAVNKKIQFTKSPILNKIIFYSYFGVDSYYFEKIMSPKMFGYNFMKLLYQDVLEGTPSPNLLKDDLYGQMISKSAELGFIVSPDSSDFEFIIGSYSMTKHDILLCLLNYFDSNHLKGDILVHESFDISLFHSENFNLIPVKNVPFQLKNYNFSIALDECGRFYFNNEGFPDALTCGFLLINFLNSNNSVPSHLKEKMENFYSLLKNNI